MRAVPTINEPAAEYSSRAKMMNLNVEENPKTGTRFGVANIPTLLVFKNGRLVDCMTGFISKKILAGRLEAWLN
jgi:thioredoxin 1